MATGTKRTSAGQQHSPKAKIHWRSVPTPAGPLLVFADEASIPTGWAALHGRANAPDGVQDPAHAAGTR